MSTTRTRPGQTLQMVLQYLSDCYPNHRSAARIAKENGLREQQSAAALTRLNQAGLVVNHERGRWSATEEGATHPLLTHNLDKGFSYSDYPELVVFESDAAHHSNQPGTSGAVSRRHQEPMERRVELARPSRAVGTADSSADLIALAHQVCDELDAPEGLSIMARLAFVLGWLKHRK